MSADTIPGSEGNPVSHKTCFRCGADLPIGDFYKHPQMADGHLNKCKACTIRDSRILHGYRRLTVVSTHPGKRKARVAVSNALRDGRLLRRPCEVCGDSKSEAHHEDYDKLLDVNWLCMKHHRDKHYTEWAA